jgi:DNA-directed RNA polymerase subunit H (RpoH/RPB5)
MLGVQFWQLPSLPDQEDVVRTLDARGGQRPEVSGIRRPSVTKGPSGDFLSVLRFGRPPT